MGNTYVFVELNEKAYMILPSGKKSEILEDRLSMRMITAYILRGDENSPLTCGFVESVEFYDNLKPNGYRDVTTDILLGLFEGGFIPNFMQIGYIYQAFNDAKRLGVLARWLHKWDDMSSGTNQKRVMQNE